MRLHDRHLVLALVCIALACGRGGDRSIVIASVQDADRIVPGLWTKTAGREYTELMFDRLADLGPAQTSVGDGGYRPRLATGWTWAKDSASVTFKLDPRARWHDGRPVVARDVKFGFDFAADPAVKAPGGADLRANADSITTPDSLTAVVWFHGHNAEQFHRIAYNLTPLPSHLLGSMPHDSVATSAYARAPVGNGPFAFGSWTPGSRMELKANPSHPIAAPKVDRVIFAIFPAADAAVRAVLAGDADVFERFGPDDIVGAARAQQVVISPQRSYNYAFLSFNTRTKDGASPHAVLALAAARRALTMAVDRKGLEKLILDTLGRVPFGPFPISQWAADSTLRQLPFDTSAAARTLDSLGWARGASGIRVKNGKPLALTLIAMSTSSTSRRYAEALQQAFGRVGVKVAVDMMDQNAFVPRLSAHDFDLALFPWGATPSPTGVAQTWGSKAFAKGSAFNAGGWSNATFDAQVDSAMRAATVADARRHYSSAFQAAIDDPPAIWLYEPGNLFGVNRRVHLNQIADRPDAWWMTIPAWDVSGAARRGTGKAP